MLNPSLHRTNLIRILRDVYADPELRTVLGFKGGTAAMLFYGLPRLSVDLDFDLLDATKKELVGARMPAILAWYGTVREASDKRYTLFFLMSYGHGEHALKVEISKRTSAARYEPKSYLGIPVLVMVKEDMVAAKLAALVGRSSLAMRDLFDLYFFLHADWRLSVPVTEESSGTPIIEVIDQAVAKVRGIGRSALLQGLGELVDEKQKAWVRDHMQEELVLELRMLRERAVARAGGQPI